MSLQPESFPALPESTARVARKAFRKGHLYLTIGDQIGQIFRDEDFRDLYALKGAPGMSPAQLLLVLIFQALENLSDREAADAVRGRIEWKYALHLELDDPGFGFPVLSEFRGRLVQHKACARILDQVLVRLRELGLLRERGRQRTDSTYVLSAARTLNRLELVIETMRGALEAVAQVAPAWLQTMARPEWRERYVLAWRSNRLPKLEAERMALAAAVGAEGADLLARLAQPDAPGSLAQLPAVCQLRQIWAQQYEEGPHGWQWRPAGTLPAGAELVVTPHDPEARHAEHRNGRVWEGYKVHFTETCDPDLPHLITQVTVAPATQADHEALAGIQQELARRRCLPRKQLVDCGYTTGPLLVSSQDQYGIELCGRIARSSAWQARQAGNFTAEMFALDWVRQEARCPAGHKNATWAASHDEADQPVVHIRFSAAQCQACPQQSRCTRSPQGRSLKLRPHFAALVAARQRQETASFHREYAPRAGIEGTISEVVREHGARVSRYIGQTKTWVQETLLAAAVNLERAARWLMGDRPETTRSSRLATLIPARAMVG